MGEVDRDATAPVFLEEAEGRVALEDRFLPEPERTAFGFVTGDELADMLEHVQRQPT